MSYSVGELARLAGVSVRTLHHYDEIGLLSASERTKAGYRRYRSADLERLYAILVYRELGFDLAGIMQILDDQTVDPLERLAQQRGLLEGQVDRLRGMLKGVERLMNAKRSGVHLTSDEMREVFGEFDPSEHAEEAQERWGETNAYGESARRTATYGKAEWLVIRSEMEEIEAGMAQAMAVGVAATTDIAMDLAEKHRLLISRWFYECSYEFHLGLGDMYITDPRFAKHYEDRMPGLSVYLHDAIRANADRRSSEKR